jgi:hypothetical protein
MGKGESTQGQVTRTRILKELAAFLALTFAVTWAICGAYIFAGDKMVPIFGQMTNRNPLFFVAVFAPSLAGVISTMLLGSRQEFIDLLRSAVKWRVGIGWFLVGLLGYPLIWLLWDLVAHLLGLKQGDLGLSRWFVTLPLIIIAGHLLKDPGALGEELGWRGYMLPRLISCLNPLSAALILGVVWAVWHLPAFYLAGLSQSSLDFGGFCVTVVALSVCMTWLFVNTSGSVLVAGIFPHMMTNAVGAAKIDTERLVMVGVALAIVLICGPSLKGWKHGRAAAPDASTG